MAQAKPFQKKGADVQKNAVRDRVHDAIGRLREENLTIPIDQRKEITQEDIEREAPVNRKTLEASYHAALLQDVLTFLAEINVGVTLIEPKSSHIPPKSSIFKQNAELLDCIEGLRYRLRTELAEKQRQIDAMAARVATLTDEIATLRRRRPADRTTLPKKTSRRSKAA